LSVKDVAEVWYRMTYFAAKYETFSDLEGPLNIIQIIWIFLCSILRP